MKKGFMLTLFASSMLFSCWDYECSKAEIRFGFIGYSPNETDTVVLRTFSRSGNFQTQIDSLVVTNENILFWQHGDTLTPAITSGLFPLTSDRDYEFYLPKVSKTYRVTSITEEQRSKRKKLGGTKEGCINGLISYEVNGRSVDARNSYSMLYLRK